MQSGSRHLNYKKETVGQYYEDFHTLMDFRYIRNVYVIFYTLLYSCSSFYFKGLSFGGGRYDVF